MPNYENSVIYTITTGQHLYVGSTRDYVSRKHHHNSCVQSYKPGQIRKSKQHLYHQIAHNNFVWIMQPYKQVSCNSKYELLCEEQKVINNLKPNMNERNAIKQVKSRDEKIAYNRAWYQRKKAERYAKDN